MAESDPTQPDNEPGQHMNQCLTLHLPDGDKITFYYLYLVKVELRLGGALNTLILRFTSEKVTLQGYRLENLHAEFSGTKPSDIYVVNPRYAIPENEHKPVVTGAFVEQRKS
jgi:hypothetical protein